MTSADVHTASAAELDAMERRIAARFMHIFPWRMVLWGIGNCLLWLSLWPLVLKGVLPLWLGFVLATLTIALSYLPSHDAQHNIIARRGHRLRWFNEFVGYFSVLPLANSFRVLRHTHYEHHKYANEPALDPDYDVHAKNTWQFLLRHFAAPNLDRYGETLQRIGRTDVLMEGILFNAAYLLILFTLAWSGYALEAALLWWLPRHLALAYIRYYLSWMPHHPGEATGRYRDTRAFKSRLGNIGSLGMQYHIVHHLYPTIPLTHTPAAYRALKPILERRGCDLGNL